MPDKNKRKDHIKKEEDNILRVPRPLGITYANLNPNQNKEALKDKIIEIYVNNNYELNGKQIRITELGTYLGINTMELMRRMNRQIERISNLFDSKDGRVFARVHFLGLIKKGLEICALTQHQTEILMAQQGKEYVPFLTGEVNRSLTNLINAQKPVADLLKMLTEKQITNIILNLDKQSETSGVHYLSPDEARLMITESGPSLLLNPALLAEKEIALGRLPDVNARNQDLTSIGIRHNGNHIGMEQPNIPNEVHDEGTFLG